MFDELPTGLKNFRTHLGIGAADMAPLMGLTLADYLALEANPDLLTPLHVRAALFAAIVVAAHHRGYSALPHELADLLKRLPRV